MLHQPSSSLRQPLLQTRQRLILDSSRQRRRAFTKERRISSTLSSFAPPPPRRAGQRRAEAGLMAPPLHGRSRLQPRSSSLTLWMKTSSLAKSHSQYLSGSFLRQELRSPQPLTSRCRSPQEWVRSGCLGPLLKTRLKGAHRTISDRFTGSRKKIFPLCAIGLTRGASNPTCRRLKTRR